MNDSINSTIDDLKQAASHLLKLLNNASDSPMKDLGDSKISSEEAKTLAEEVTSLSDKEIITEIEKAELKEEEGISKLTTEINKCHNAIEAHIKDTNADGVSESNREEKHDGAVTAAETETAAETAAETVVETAAETVAETAVETENKPPVETKQGHGNKNEN